MSMLACPRTVNVIPAIRPEPAATGKQLALDRSTAEDGGMKTNVSEFPKHPLPHVPPTEPPRPHAQPPTVFVYERQGWEYKVVSREADQAPLGQDELNALGKDGWELVGVVPVSHTVQFYLKRLRA